MIYQSPLKALCVAGPTGSGKSSLAVKLARILNGEIVNADSRQVYADFPILTAQPGADEKGEIPHHLYGFLDIGEKINAGKWTALALDTARQIVSRGKLPIFVGGTGLYFRALLQGLAQIPAVEEKTRQYVWNRLVNEGSERLYRELLVIDAEYASKVHPRDGKRIARALEVYEFTGKSFSWWHKNAMVQPCCEAPLYVVGASLLELEPILEARIGKMLANGALAEASKAYGKYADSTYGAWTAIGCAEFLAYLENRLTLDETKSLWLANTRAYAKRQLTWFRGRSEAIWVPYNIDAGLLADNFRKRLIE